MNVQSSSKIIGALVVGSALVAGAYTLSNFGKPSGAFEPATATQTQQASPIRSAIAVLDKDQNGIEDWRDDFITTEPIVINSDYTNYEPPTTLTGQTGVVFLQDMIRSRNSTIGNTQEQVIAGTIKTLEQQTSHAIYDTPHIKIIKNWDEETIRAYANATALAILTNAQTDIEYELLILQDILNRNDRERLKELSALAEIYRLTRDAVVNIPVPELLVKEHLDLINTLHAVHNDIHGMTLSYEDPVYSLMRIKRYQDDVEGMRQALENMYTAFEPYSSLFTVDDPAVFFIEFSPSNRIRI